MMGAAYGLVSPYLPMPHALTRKRLFAEYGLDPKLGSPSGPGSACGSLPTRGAAQ